MITKADTAPKDRSRLWAALCQRCPRCCRGKMFRGLLTMNEVCPRCYLRFEREPGYFLGAMYFSYPLSIPILGLGIWLWHLILPEWRWEMIILLSGFSYIPFVPAVFRYSRVLWIYFDHWAWPSSFNKLE
jgi:uncharacterized protein (DUF983 family)